MREQANTLVISRFKFCEFGHLDKKGKNIYYYYFKSGFFPVLVGSWELYEIFTYKTYHFCCPVLPSPMYDFLSPVPHHLLFCSARCPGLLPTLSSIQCSFLVWNLITGPSRTEPWWSPDFPLFLCLKLWPHILEIPVLSILSLSGHPVLPSVWFDWIPLLGWDLN